MTKFYSQLAFVFRASNSALIYPQYPMLLKVRKLIFLLSTLMYKRWMKRVHKSELCLINNVDRDLSMRIDISKAMGAAFFWIAYHEFNDWRYLHQVLRSDMVFLDVGSNQGEYALFAAKRLTRGRVFAFEPVDIFYQMLCFNKAINQFNNIEALPYGLSNVEGSLPIFMGANDEVGEHEGLATLYPTDERGRFVQQIELKVFDDIVGLLKIDRIDVVKIDVEGAEMKVLEGMRKSLTKFKPLVLIEMNQITSEAAGFKMIDVIEFFKKLNYSLFEIGKNGALTTSSSNSAVFNGVFVHEN